ncbi:MAG: hypothetical protein OEY49_06080 [Candidatus Heimdallarchaeota archaeon]|nr:hypothetical protein [Candidatus Heimdallarchaeota archaeon]
MSFNTSIKLIPLIKSSKLVSANTFLFFPGSPNATPDMTTSLKSGLYL